MVNFDGSPTLWSVTSDAVPNDLQPRARRFTANQKIVPLTLSDIVEFCGIDEDLTGEKIINMIGMSYEDNYPIQLMSSYQEGQQVFYVNKTTGQITTGTSEQSVVYPVAYVDLNFLTIAYDNLGWSINSRATTHHYTLNYDVYSTVDEGTGITIDATGSPDQNLLVNSTDESGFINLTSRLTNNRVKIEFYAFSNAGKYLKINNETFTIDGIVTSDVIREFVNSNINIEFVDGSNAGSSSTTYQRHFILYFTQTDDYIATNYPELIAID